MQILDQVRTLEVLCATTQKWGMFISWNDQALEKECGSIPAVWKELFKAAPYLTLKDHAQMICEERAYMLFDTEEELMAYYSSTIGESGPTDLNDYDGPARVYAITCNPQGQAEHENT
jgi:hypothetical protein